MENALVVRGGQAGAEAAADFCRLVRSDSPDPSEQCREILTADELHRQEGLSVGLADVVDPAYVRMRDLARGADLAPKACQPLGIAHERRRQELQRDDLAKRQILGAIHFAHPAFADDPDDAIAAGEQRAGRKASADARVAPGRRRDPSQDGRFRRRKRHIVR